jgi:hypothetical protein
MAHKRQCPKRLPAYHQCKDSANQDTTMHNEAMSAEFMAVQANRR